MNNPGQEQDAALLILMWAKLCTLENKVDLLMQTHPSGRQSTDFRDAPGESQQEYFGIKK